MKKTKALILSAMLCLPGLGWAASAINWDMEPFAADLHNKPSLQNGMRLYMNYCIGCHSLKFQRYQMTVDFLGIPHETALENLIFSDQKIGDPMTTAMDPEGAKGWFGAPPPDLTQVAKTRGSEWIYNYMKTFYDDPSRPLGVNNKVFENVGMPNVLAELQGIQREACIQVPKLAENGGEMRDPLVPGLAITEEKCGQLVVDEGTGLYTAQEFDAAVYDLTNFLYYVAEPTRLERHRTGIFVLLFLVILGCFTYLLNREYWKDVR